MENAYQSRARKIYSELRSNIVKTVYDSWRQTGFAWEQYNDATGAGQRTQHFTGWTALVVRIMAMPHFDTGEVAPPYRIDPETARYLPDLILWLALASLLVYFSLFRRQFWAVK